MSNIITPKIFKTKNKLNAYALLKNSKVYKNKLIPISDMTKPKHFTPYTTEWINSVYCYNKNIIKLLPTSYVNAYSLIKSYFNLYMIKYNNKTKAKRLRVRTKKSTTIRLIIGKPIMKHTNDILYITVYTYDRSSTHYREKITDALTLDQIKEGYFAFFVNLKKEYILLERTLKYKLNNKYFKEHLRNIIINKYKTFFCKSTKNYNKTLTHNKINLIKDKNNPLLHFFKKELVVAFDKNLNNYIKKVMWDEVVSICYQQCICFEQSKYEKQHIQLLTTLLENVYKKKVVLDIVNLNYFYNSSNIFSNTILTKLKIRRNKVITLLGLTLDRFNIPPIDRLKVYEEMYNRKVFRQNGILRKIILNRSQKFKHLDESINDDVVDTVIYKKSNLYSWINSFSNIKKIDETKKLQLKESNTNKIMDSLKNKFTKGIRIEVAGRLTKRNTAERSIYKLKYKGNVKNLDSSMKKLSTSLLRGHAKSNLVYVQSKSRLRIGAFGLKTWVSSN